MHTNQEVCFTTTQVAENIIYDHWCLPNHPTPPPHPPNISELQKVFT